jgi:hypothetical protein
MLRRGKESYSDIAEAVMPDILVEDDCESIGGSNQMTITGCFVHLVYGQALTRHCAALGQLQ